MEYILTDTLEINAELDQDAKTFHMVAYTGGKLAIDGFDDPVVVDLDGLQAEGHIPINIKHKTDDEMVLGETDPDKIVNDGETLTLGGRITASPEDSPSAKRILAMGAKGHHWQASIGAKIEESHDIAAGEKVFVNGQEQVGPFVLVTKAVLRHSAVVSQGADKNTSFVLNAEASIEIEADAGADDESMDAEASESTDSGVMDTGFEGWLKELSLDESTLSEKARNALLQQYAATSADKDDALDAADSCESSDEDEPTDEKPKKKEDAMAASTTTDLDAAGATDIEAQIKKQRQALAAEARRVDQINAICKKDSKLAAKAIEDGWNAEKTENYYLKRQLRQGPPAGHVKTRNPADMLMAYQGGLMIRAGVKLDHEAFSGEQAEAMGLPDWIRAGVNTDQRQKIMEASQEFRDMSLPEMCKEVCIAAGITPDRRTRTGWIHAAVSGGQLADIFTTNINSLLLQKLISEVDTTAGWTKESDAANFQTMERTRLTKGPRLTKHARGKSADNATRSDVMQSYKIARYSQQFKVDEMDILDDKFKALQDIPSEMAEACVVLRPDLVYSILLANPTINKEGGTSSALFSASQPGSQSNYVASGAALASGTLQTAMATMFNFTENGRPVNTNPTHLIIPAQLFGTAAGILQSPTIVLAGTAGTVTTKGNVNELQKMQEAWGLIAPVSDSRISNGVTDPNTGTAYSGTTTQWWLVSNKAPTIEVAYLRGSGKAPQVRQYILDRGEWGIGWDVNMDVGAKALSWQGFYSANA